MDILKNKFNQFSMRSFLAGLFSTATCYLWVTGQPVPSDLLAVNLLVVGIFLGPPQKAAEPLLAKPYVPGDERA